MTFPERHPASFRDPDSRVFVAGERILRGFSAAGAARFKAVQATGLLDDLIRDGLLMPTRDSPGVAADSPLAGFEHVVEHEPVAFVSHPFEWPFALLRGAALLHLDVHLRALERGVTLVDASAYNVQFRGASPVYIDVGSFRPYEPGELWAGHRQFCEQFLNPLLLAADLGVPYHSWLRGSLEGIPTTHLARLLPRRRWLSIRHLFHVLMPARAESLAARREKQTVERIRKARLPLEGYQAMLRQLHRWIESLSPEKLGATTWAEYGSTRTYQSAEIERKRSLVGEFAAWCRPGMLWDMGCNDGEFVQVALAAGAKRAIGFDADTGALEQACARAKAEGLDFLPLYLDAADPSPGLGWRNRERASLAERARPDAVMALAFEHHLALGRNIPLEEVVEFLVGLAPRGLVEFVPKSDPTAQRMLALKGDIFPGYGVESFERALASRARIARAETVSETGRRLYWFER